MEFVRLCDMCLTCPKSHQLLLLTALTSVELLLTPSYGVASTELRPVYMRIRELASVELLQICTKVAALTLGELFQIDTNISGGSKLSQLEEMETKCSNLTYEIFKLPQRIFHRVLGKIYLQLTRAYTSRLRVSLTKGKGKEPF